MRAVPNDIIQSLMRHLPLILENVDADALNINLRLCNAVRLTKKTIKRLERIEQSYENNKDQAERRVTSLDKIKANGTR